MSAIQVILLLVIGYVCGLLTFFLIWLAAGTREEQ